jgi:hypothetical protein
MIRLVMVVLSMFVALPSFAAVFLWDAPTKYTDGSPLTPARYSLYENGALAKTIPAPALSTAYPAKNRAVYSMTTLDSFGAESAQSNTVRVYLQPGSPANFRLQ